MESVHAKEKERSVNRIYVEESERARAHPSPRHELSQKFHDLLAECGDLHDKKQEDYGRLNDPFANVKASGEFGVEPWVGAMIRANDKMRRLQALANGSELQNEGARDSFMDLAVYALIACVLYESGE